MKIKFNKQDGVTAEMAWTGQEENVEVNICLCWANGKFLWPVQKEGKSKQQQSPEEKRVLLPCCCGDHPQSSVYTYKRGQFWHSPQLSPAQPDSNKAQAYPLPPGPPQLFCVGRLVFLPDAHCVCLYV